jgi:hypothetical protein
MDIKYEPLGSSVNRIRFRLKSETIKYRTVRLFARECSWDNVRFIIEYSLGMHPFFRLGDSKDLSSSSLCLLEQTSKNKKHVSSSSSSSSLQRKSTPVQEYVDMISGCSKDRKLQKLQESDFIPDGSTLVIRRRPLDFGLIAYVPPFYRETPSASSFLTQKSPTTITKDSCTRCRVDSHSNKTCPYASRKDARSLRVAERHPSSIDLVPEDLRYACKFCGKQKAHFSMDCPDKSYVQQIWLSARKVHGVIKNTHHQNSFSLS